MKRISLFAIVGLFLAVSAHAQSQPSRVVRGAPAQNAPAAQAPTRAPAARSAVAVPQAVSARSATVTPAPVQTGRSAVIPVNAGSKAQITAAASNTGLVDQDCRELFNGCMDSFCMGPNENGGRCLCSDKHAGFNDILEQIRIANDESLRLATEGVEFIELGANASHVLDRVNQVTNPVQTAEQSARKTLDMSIFDDFDASRTEYDNIFASIAVDVNDPLAGRSGDALYATVRDICMGRLLDQAPNCTRDSTMLTTLYTTQIASDCRAFENDLRARHTDAANKLRAAQGALRAAALEVFQTENKFDLGECVFEFRSCMADRGGCGDDFTGCVGIAASQNAAQNRNRRAATMKSIPSATGTTYIEIALSSYDTLMAKKPLCESITNQCVAVKDRVWDVFLTDIAPVVKTAEILQENDNRQNCIANVSDCFRKGCADTFDPEAEEPQYDACITDPRNMAYICKSQLEACGIAVDPVTNTADTNNSIWGFIVRRMAAMRDNACTREVKACMAHQDRCGSDYANCFGLDMESLLQMCPQSRMVSCIDKGRIMDESRYNDLIMGILLNVDNKLLQQCMAALESAMIQVCGDTGNCDAAVPDGIGGRSIKYEACGVRAPVSTDGTIVWNSPDIKDLDCHPQVIITDYLNRETWVMLLSGLVHWDLISINSTPITTVNAGPSSSNNFGRITSVTDYKAALERKLGNIDDTQMEAINDRVLPELGYIQTSIDDAVRLIESDPKVSMCLTGRDISQISTNRQAEAGRNRAVTTARFPNLTQQTRLTVADSVLRAAKQNYFRDWDKTMARMMEDSTNIAEKLDNIQRADAATENCVAMAEMSALPKHNTPPVINDAKKKAWWKVAVGAVVIAAAVIAIPVTGGTSAFAIGSVASWMAATAITVGVAAGVGLTATGISDAAGPGKTGAADVINWNYKETITTTFNRDTMTCTKIRVFQNCADSDNKNMFCKHWADPVEQVTNIPMGRPASN